VLRWGSRSSDDRSSYTAPPEDLDVFDATFVCALILGAFCRLAELDLEVVGQGLEPGRAVLAAGSSLASSTGGAATAGPRERRETQ
jgi:hypothetical protein